MARPRRISCPSHLNSVVIRRALDTRRLPPRLASGNLSFRTVGQNILERGMTLAGSRRLFTVMAVCQVLGWISSAQAGSYSAIYAFGDSLSDVGNVFVGTSGTEPAPHYFAGRFSNGPIWLDYLAAQLGNGPMIPSLLWHRLRIRFGHNGVWADPIDSAPGADPCAAGDAVRRRDPRSRAV